MKKSFWQEVITLVCVIFFIWQFCIPAAAEYERPEELRGVPGIVWTDDKDDRFGLLKWTLRPDEVLRYITGLEVIERGKPRKEEQAGEVYVYRLVNSTLGWDDSSEENSNLIHLRSYDVYHKGKIVRQYCEVTKISTDKLNVKLDKALAELDPGNVLVYLPELEIFSERLKKDGEIEGSLVIHDRRISQPEFGNDQENEWDGFSDKRKKEIAYLKEQGYVIEYLPEHNGYIAHIETTKEKLQKIKKELSSCWKIISEIKWVKDKLDKVPDLSRLNDKEYINDWAIKNVPQVEFADKIANAAADTIKYGADLLGEILTGEHVKAKKGDFRLLVEADLLDNCYDYLPRQKTITAATKEYLDKQLSRFSVRDLIEEKLKGKVKDIMIEPILEGLDKIIDNEIIKKRVRVLAEKYGMEVAENYINRLIDSGAKKAEQMYDEYFPKLVGEDKEDESKVSGVHLAPVSIFKNPEKFNAEGESAAVGGVMMEFNTSGNYSQDLNSFSGINIDKPIIISLNQLFEKLKDYRDTWGNLPQSLRYPGDIDRINGFVIDDVNQDILVIGRRSGAGNSIDINDFITGLKAVWESGLSPGCSLDPSPYDCSGPQYVRIIAVPADSNFARIMLDADYRMKLITTYGAEGYGVQGYRSVSHLYAAEYSTKSFQEPVYARFWLCPKSLNDSNFWISDDGKCAFFDTGVQVLTENLIFMTGGLSGLGDVSSLDEEGSGIFTDFYKEFEEKVRDDKGRYVFKELHGLFDITAMCMLLRRKECNFDILKKMSSLPIAKVDVPLFYNGICHEIPGTNILSSGGVDIRSRIRSRMLKVQTAKQMNAGIDIDRLKEQAAGKAINKTNAFISVKPGKDEDGRKVEMLFLKGYRYLAAGKYEDAKQIFMEILNFFPDDGDGLAYLALSQAGLGNPAEAQKLIEKCLKIDSNDPLFISISLQLKQLQDKEIINSDCNSTAALRDLSNQYIEQSKYLSAMELFAAAVDKARLAVKADKDNLEAWLILADVLIKVNNRQEAGEILLKIRKMCREQLREDENNKDLKWQLVSALMLTVSLNLNVDDLETKNALAVKLEKNIRDLEEAYGLIPSHPEFLTFIIISRRLKVKIFDDLGIGGSYKGALKAADLLVDSYPELALGYAYRGLLYYESGDYARACEDIDKALELNVNSGLALIVKGKLLKQEGDFKNALDFLKRGAMIESYWRNEVIDDIKECQSVLTNEL